MKGRVYKITSQKTIDFYIGSTIQELKHRFKTHRSNAHVGKKMKLYECMREHGIDNFTIELIEEFEINNKNDIKLGEKEKEYFDKLKPTLNMIAPKISDCQKELGKIYIVKYIDDDSFFYIGSTKIELPIRLCQHKSASLDGTTLLYKFMREKNRDNFVIDCIEDNIPLDQLTVRENYWIIELKPSLNKNINLCITNQERDRLKYIKNKEKRLKQVSDRRLLKRDEINAQKRVHYQANKERLSQTDKQRRKVLREKEIILFTENPNFTKETLQKYIIIELKEIAKKFGLKISPKLKPALIEKILDRQQELFN